MQSFEQLLSEYDYSVLPEHIALVPAEPRDSAKLLVYTESTDTVAYDTYANLAQHLPKNAFLVFNDTKVIPARIYAHKKTGGKVEILCTEVSPMIHQCKALTNRHLQVGETLTSHESTLIVTAVHGHEYTFSVTPDITSLIQRHGSTPIPPYLKKTPLTESELRVRYQTIFAKYDGSAAAPTASLHFTHSLMRSLEEAGIEHTKVTLHVNLGTFAPLTPEAVHEGKLHEEHYVVTEEAADAINSAIRMGKIIIPVGTTALRTLESAARNDGSIRAESASTRLFITPGYSFKIARGIITNFHVPKSSLLMLVASFIGREKLFALYEKAKAHGFRFFSFGDGMLIIPNEHHNT